MNYPDFLSNEIASLTDYKGYRIAVIFDMDAENPRKEWGHPGKMELRSHGITEISDQYVIPRGTFGYQHDLDRFLIVNPGVMFPIYMYSHSGDTISTTPFGDRFDSELAGFIFLDRETILEECVPINGKKLTRLTKEALELAVGLLELEVKEYNQYLIGDIYGYSISKLNPNRGEGQGEFIIEDERVGECWGFYGETNCLDEAKQAVDNLVEAQSYAL